MEDKYLWKFSWYMRRGGNVEGLFVASEKEVKDIIGMDVYFGEIHGKHSEVYGVLSRTDFNKLEISPKTVAEVSEYLGETWSGYNPIYYLRVSCDDCGDYIEIGEGETYHEIDGDKICEHCYEKLDEEENGE